MEVGTRVGAVLSADATTVKLLGYGVYEGNFLPPGAEEPNADYVKRLFHPDPVPTKEGETEEQAIANLSSILAGSPFHANPRIRLDNGEVVWGRECWWGPEEGVRSAIKDRKVIMCSLVRNEIGEPVEAVEVE